MSTDFLPHAVQHDVPRFLCHAANFDLLGGLGVPICPPAGVDGGGSVQSGDARPQARRIFSVGVREPVVAGRVSGFPCIICELPFFLLWMALPFRWQRGQAVPWKGWYTELMKAIHKKASQDEYTFYEARVQELLVSVVRGDGSCESRPQGECC